MNNRLPRESHAPILPTQQSSSLTMDQLYSMFSRFMPPEIIAKAEDSFQRGMSSQNKNLRVLPPDPISEAKPPWSFPSMDAIDEVRFRASLLENIQNTKPRFSVLERLPCANVEVEKYKTCPNPATMACSACKLVSYCSKVCNASRNLFLIASEPHSGIVGLPDCTLAQSQNW